MQTSEIIKTIQNAHDLATIGKTLQKATIFQYVSGSLNEKYDYKFQLKQINNGQVFNFTDMDNHPVDLADIKDTVLTVILNPDE